MTRRVPSRILLALTALLVLPGVFLCVWGQSGAVFALGAVLLSVYVLVSLLDFLLSRDRLEGVEFHFPDTLRGTRGAEQDLRVECRNLSKGRLPFIRFGLELGQNLRCVNERIVDWPTLAFGEKARSSYPIIGLRRGTFLIPSVHYETGSPWRLWLVRSSAPADVTIHVYPNLAPERKRLSSQFLVRGADGIRILRQQGKGRDFEQLREYQPGDEFADIDWKATARRREPVTRTYQIEKTQEVYVIIDHSRGSARELREPVEGAFAEDWLYSETGQGGEYLITTQLEKFLQSALLLGAIAERQGDQFGCLTFADRVSHFIRAKGGTSHFHLIRDAIVTLDAKRVAPDFQEATVQLATQLRSRALLVFLLDLTDPLTAEQFCESIALLSKRHLVVVVMIRPEGAFPAFSSDAELATIDDGYEELAGHLKWKELNKTAAQLKRLGVDMIMASHEGLVGEVIGQYFDAKERQRI